MEWICRIRETIKKTRGRFNLDNSIPIDLPFGPDNRWIKDRKRKKSNPAITTKAKIRKISIYKAILL